MIRGKPIIPGWWIALAVTSGTIGLGVLGVIIWAVIRIVEKYT